MRLVHDARVAACGFGLLLAMAAPAEAESLTVRWDPSPDSTVTGYVVYIGTQSGVYSETRDVGNATSLVLNVQPGQSYYFSVASCAGPLVGPGSAEVSWTPNHSPVLTNPGSQQGTLGSYTSLQLNATDPEHSAVTYQASGLPTGLDVNSSGAIAGTPTAVGTFAVTVRASDGALAATETFTWTIAPAAPDVTPPAVSISVPGTGDAPVLVVGQNPTPPADKPVSVAPTTPTADTTPPASSPAPPLSAIERWRDDSLGSTARNTIWRRATQTASPSVPRSGSTTRPRPWTTATEPTPTTTNTSGGFQRLKAAVVSGAIGNAAGTPTATNTTARSLASSVRAKVVAARAAKTITTTKPFITLAGTAVDNRVIDRVDWATDRGLTGKATGTDTWIAGVPLQRGLNHITIKVRDTSGNESSGTMVIDYKAKPSLEN